MFLSLVEYISILDESDIPDTAFGFNLFLCFVFLFYVPLCLVIVCLLYYYKINRYILSHIILGIAYCAFPFLLTDLLDKYSSFPSFLSKIGLRDYIF